MLKHTGLLGAGAAAGTLLLGKIGMAAGLQKTPRQPQGPFYPIKDQVDKDADMTKVKGSAVRADGSIVTMHGTVLDVTTGGPIAGALVEFWQACASGKYDHPADPNTAALDPNFQYWAQVRTGAAGEFRIKTIKPGAYPADANWIRPPHIHVKVHKEGYPSLTTQLYFSGDPLNDSDGILQALTPAQQKLVIVELSDAPVAEEQQAHWSIHLAKFSGRRTHASGSLTATPEID